MDPVAVVSKFPGVEVFDGIPDAWHWSPVSGLDFAAALSADGRHLFQVNARDTYDQALVAAILRTARENSALLLENGALLSAPQGFHHPGRDFEVIAAARPGVHRYHEVQQPELQQVTWAVFPGYTCEFADPGRYSLEDARESFIRFLTPADLNREPVPFLRLWYDNTVTKGGTDGPDGILAAEKTLYREIKLLEGAPGSFVRFENFRGSIFRIEWNPERAWTLSEETQNSGPEPFEISGLLSFVERSLR
ncbi:hypothetical protein [Streptomyces sp. SID5643]|uniref:hypothetical protein n=1 Tax=Streptomyces sp. SID5643 TaxID=2690307 RepID=UPI00136BED1D|nr:hypothetical protein [Streptomyces sp. SID5643]MZF83757.1 hypothetical protein [Streptomyces sp. SID5643]